MGLFYTVFGLVVLMTPSINAQFGWDLSGGIPANMQIALGILLILGGNILLKIDTLRREITALKK